MIAPLPQTWWVDPGRFLAGGYPGDPDPARATEKLQCLLDAGVRCFVSLQEPGEMGRGSDYGRYAPVVRNLARDMDEEVAFHHFPIPDMGVKDVPFTARILRTIDHAINEGQCVYVHCWGGHGRTGTIVGCWLRERGLSGPETLQHLAQLRRHDEVLTEWDCPQTAVQRDRILRWKSGTGCPSG